MPIVKSIFNLSDQVKEEIISLYINGVSLDKIASQFGFSRTPIKNLLKKLEVPINKPGRPTGSLGLRFIPSTDIIERYLRGEGTTAIAKTELVKDNTILRYLRRHGIKIRTRSQSCKIWNEHHSIEDRKNRFGKGAGKGFVPGQVPPDQFYKIALGKQRTKAMAQPYETTLLKLLEARGLTCVPQLAIGNYNIDIAISPIAVEIHAATNNPFNLPALQKRIKYLIDCGWYVIYVWIYSSPIGIGAAEAIISYLKEARSNPSTTSKYRMIRGSGKEAPIFSFE